MKFLSDIQLHLEDVYGAPTGLNALDFVRSTDNFSELGEMIVHQSQSSEDLDIALLFDRDVLDACGHALGETQTDEPTNVSPSDALSVSFEELSHFVYLSFNHQRGRDITSLELEIQSEVDRILLAFHGPHRVNREYAEALFVDLCEKKYSQNLKSHDRYETARLCAFHFLRLIGKHPQAWCQSEFDQLRRFFHNDLSGKIYLSRNM